MEKKADTTVSIVRVFVLGLACALGWFPVLS